MRPRTGPTTVKALADGSYVGMTQEAFARWHVDDMLFVRPVVSRSGEGFAVYGADGTFLEVVDSMGEVMIAANKHGMEIAAVH